MGGHYKVLLEIDGVAWRGNANIRENEIDGTTSEFEFHGRIVGRQTLCVASLTIARKATGSGGTDSFTTVLRGVHSSSQFEVLADASRVNVTLKGTRLAESSDDDQLR